jgi:GDP-6-deoxy-D-talose 4-dehydrogenase
MKRALITGIDGFTGKYVAAELEAHGWDVWGIGVSEAKLRPQTYTADLLDPKLLESVVAEIQPDAVVHLAAIAFVGHGNVEEVYRTNLIGSRNLLVALAGLPKKPDRVALASSANVYGNAQAGVIAESTTLNPTNDYAVSKLAMEHMARLWLEVLPIVIVRPFNYTGVGQSDRFLLPKIVSHVRRGAAAIELGNLDVWRDFSDVRSVANAYRRLLETRSEGETVNVCSGRVYSLREILALVQKISGHEMRVEVNPAFIRSREVARLQGDPAKLRNLIGDWDTLSLEETLRWMLAEQHLAAPPVESRLR